MGSAAVSFVSLFLSLTTGLHPVEVSVTGPVAAVEIRIDGETVAVMQRAPWRTKCDFGRLRPLVLEAVALDAEGRECARSRQQVNLPRQAVESSLVLERTEDGRPSSARLIPWKRWPKAWKKNQTSRAPRFKLKAGVLGESSRHPFFFSRHRKLQRAALRLANKSGIT